MKTKKYVEDIRRYQPANAQEAADRAAMLAYIEQNPGRVLAREDTIAHITSSGFVVNEARDRVLLVHHSLRGVWSWTGGHADGDGDLPAVALREAREETGAAGIRLLSGEIVSLDIFPVAAHTRRGQYVNAHLHLSVAYLMVCGEDAALRPRTGENTAVAWFPAGVFKREHFSEADAYLYQKLLQKALLR